MTVETNSFSVSLARNAGLGADKLLHAVRYLILLILSQLRKHRKGDDFGRDALRYREIALLVSQVLIRLLQMQRNWIVNTSPDSRLRQMGLQRFAILHAYNVQVINALGPLRLAWNSHGTLGLREELVITMRQLSARLIPLRQMAQFHTQPSCLDRIQTAVVTLDVVVILFRLTV